MSIHVKPHLWLIRFVGLIVPRRLRADWRREWESELQWREAMLADWDKLDLHSKLYLLRRSSSACWDALWLQPKRLEDEMFEDLRHGMRMLIKNPGFTAVTVLTLALGIGANAAIFSVVNGVLLSPLPYTEPQQLMTLHASKPSFEAGSVSYPNFRDWQKENTTFSAMAVVRGYGYILTTDREASRVSAGFISSDFFRVLGVKPALGRDFQTGEDEIGAQPIALISASFWNRTFNSDPEISGKSLTLDNGNYTIVGVLPANFRSPFGNPAGADVYVPIGQWTHPALKNRGVGLGIHGIGRLKPGVSLPQAQADLDRVSRALSAAYPDTNRNIGAKIITLEESTIGNVAPTLLMLLVAVGFVLLIACVNVGNLLLARSTSRSREFAVRSALGAGRWRLLRQLLTESILLAIIGGGLGLTVAALGMRVALGALPDILPRVETVTLDWRVVLFALVISVLTGILSGLAPQIRGSHLRLSETLKEGGHRSGNVRHRAQSVLVAVEVGLALVLLICAGLMIRSLNLLWNIDPGFRTENVLKFGLSLPPPMRTGDPQAMRAHLRELSGKWNSMPGVVAASMSWGSAPLQGDDDLSFWREGRPKPANPSEMNPALVYRVEPEYLKTMSIPLTKGRFFDEHDNELSRPVIVIDEVLAHRYFPNEDPIGKRLNFDEDESAEIVGVVGHVNQWGLDVDDKHGLRAQIFEPFRQIGDNGLKLAASRIEVVLLAEPGRVGTSPGTSAMFESIRHTAHDQNSLNVVFGPRTMSEIVAGTLATRKFSMILLDVFALIALALASVGLYGVISYLVSQRTSELGIRLALGAQRGDVFRLVLNDGMKMALIGIAIGLVFAFWITRLMSSLVYGISTTDPLTFIFITLLLIAIAALACFIPARRATQVDPLVALRHE